MWGHTRKWKGQKSPQASPPESPPSWCGRWWCSSFFPAPCDLPVLARPWTRWCKPKHEERHHRKHSSLKFINYSDNFMQCILKGWAWWAWFPWANLLKQMKSIESDWKLESEEKCGLMFYHIINFWEGFLGNIFVNLILLNQTMSNQHNFLSSIQDQMKTVCKTDSLWCLSQKNIFLPRNSCASQCVQLLDNLNIRSVRKLKQNKDCTRPALAFIIQRSANLKNAACQDDATWHSAGAKLTKLVVMDSGERQ